MPGTPLRPRYERQRPVPARRSTYSPAARLPRRPSVVLGRQAFAADVLAVLLRAIQPLEYQVLAAVARLVRGAVSGVPPLQLPSGKQDIAGTRAEAPARGVFALSNLFTISGVANERPLVLSAAPAVSFQSSIGSPSRVAADGPLLCGLARGVRKVSDSPER